MEVQKGREFRRLAEGTFPRSITITCYEPEAGLLMVDSSENPSHSDKGSVRSRASFRCAECRVSKHSLRQPQMESGQRVGVSLAGVVEGRTTEGITMAGVELDVEGAVRT